MAAPAKDYDKIAAGLGGVNYDSLAMESGAAPSAQQIGMKTAAEGRSRLAAQAGAALPYVGGLIGGLAGGIPGAAAGGVLGHMGEQAVTGTVVPPQNAVGEALGAGATQGAFQALGEAATPAARLAMRAALKVTPEVAQTAIREGITATKAGLNRLMSKIAATSMAERQIVRGASSQGIGWTPAQTLADNAFTKAQSELAGAPADEISALAKLREKFVRDNPQPLNPVDQLSKRRYYDRQTQAFYAGQPRGAKPALDAKSVWNRAIGNELRQNLRTVVPEITYPEVYQKLTGTASTPADLQALKQAAFPAVRKAGSLGERVTSAAVRPAIGATLGAAGGALASPYNRGSHALEGAALGAFLTAPQVMSLTALLAARPETQALLQLLPRLAGMTGAVQQAGQQP